MTSTVALFLALSLLINGVNLLADVDDIKDKYFESKLVYLLGTSLVLREVNLIPCTLRNKCPLVCMILEVPPSILLLEWSLVYIWGFIQSLIVVHSDDILLFLSEDLGLNWIVCHLCCCRRNNCSEMFAALLLRAASFGVLLANCCYTDIMIK